MNHKGFNIYYINYNKVYEIAMMINNKINTKIDRSFSRRTSKEEKLCGTLSAKGDKNFLTDLKSSVTGSQNKSISMSNEVVESFEVKTTKSILLRSVKERCKDTKSFMGVNEGDLIKLDDIRLELFDEESLRQLLILRRDALKGIQVEGVEINNLVKSLFQDYAYVLKGVKSDENNVGEEVIIKVPMDVKSEFESGYSIDDLLIGHVSIIGIYKGNVIEKNITSNTFQYFQNIETKEGKVFKSNGSKENVLKKTKTTDGNIYKFIDVLAIIQDVSFDYEDEKEKIHWWNKLGLWLSKLGRKKNEKK